MQPVRLLNRRESNNVLSVFGQIKSGWGNYIDTSSMKN